MSDKQKHNDTSFYCDRCSSNFIRRNDFAEHNLTEHGELPVQEDLLECKICLTERFLYKSELDNHVSNEHSLENLLNPCKTAAIIRAIEIKSFDGIEFEGSELVKSEPDSGVHSSEAKDELKKMIESCYDRTLAQKSRSLNKYAAFSPETYGETKYEP